MATTVITQEPISTTEFLNNVTTGENANTSRFCNRCCRPAAPEEACGPQDIWFCVCGDPCLVWIVGGAAGLIGCIFGSL